MTVVATETRPLALDPDAPVTPRRAGVAVAFGVVFGLVVPAAMIGTGGYHNADPTALSLGVLFVIYCAIRMAALLYRHKVAPFFATFWIFNYVALGLAPIAQQLTGIQTTPLLDSGSRHRIMTYLFLFVCVAIFDAAYISRIGLRTERIARQPVRRELDTTRLVALAVVGVIFAAYSINKLGGVGSFFTSRQAHAAAKTASGVIGANQSNGLASGSKVASSLYTTVAQVPPFVCLLILTYGVFRNRASKLRSNPAIGLLWLVLLIVNLILNNPFSNARYWFLTVVLAFAFARNGTNSRDYVLLLAGGITLAALFFPYLNYFRSGSSVNVATQSGSFKQQMATTDFDQFTMMENSLTVQRLVGNKDGRQALTDVLFFVPRSAWSSKGYDTGTYLAEEIGSTKNLNLSSPLESEFQTDFGLPGAIIGMGIFGILLMRGDEAFSRVRARSKDAVERIDYAVPIFAGFLFIVLRGPLLQSMGWTAVIWLCLLFLFPKRVERGMGGAPLPDRAAPSVV